MTLRKKKKKKDLVKFQSTSLDGRFCQIASRSFTGTQTENQYFAVTLNPLFLCILLQHVLTFQCLLLMQPYVGGDVQHVSHLHLITVLIPCRTERHLCATAFVTYYFVVQMRARALLHAFCWKCWHRCTSWCWCPFKSGFMCNLCCWAFGRILLTDDDCRKKIGAHLHVCILTLQAVNTPCTLWGFITEAAFHRFCVSNICSPNVYFYIGIPQICFVFV